MGLTGIDPSDPTPAHRRELIVAAGKSAGGPPSYKVLLFGNKTAVGSETVDTLGEQIADDADAEARMGTRSELYAMYRKFVEVDAGAQMFFIAVTEATGSAATVTFTFAGGPATGASTVKVEYHGETFEVAVAEGDTVTNIRDAVIAAFPGADQGRLQGVASTGVGAGDVDLDYIHDGPRGTLVLENSARMTFTRSVGVTVTKGAVTPGTVEDTGDAAFAAAAAGEFYLWVFPWHATTAVTSSDNQIGEGIRGANGVVTQALPINGKEQTVHVGLVGTQAQATAVATGAGANSARAYFYHAENNDWSPAMLAAHNAGVFRSLTVSHPAQLGPVGAKGAVGYTSTDLTVYNVPDPFDKDDRPTLSEVRADLDNGVTPINFSPEGRAFIPRIITSRSQNANGDNDYRAREGHITPVADFFWNQVEQLYANNLQPIIADNLKEGQRPTARTTTPSQVTDIIQSVINDGVSSTPVGASFVGPYLAPDKQQEMLDSVDVNKGVASFSAAVEINAVEHLIKSETTVRETSAAY